MNKDEKTVVCYTGTSAVAKRLTNANVYTSFDMTAVKIVNKFKFKAETDVYWCGKEGGGEFVLYKSVQDVHYLS